MSFRSKLIAKLKAFAKLRAFATLLWHNRAPRAGTSLTCSCQHIERYRCPVHQDQPDRPKWAVLIAGVGNKREKEKNKKVKPSHGYHAPDLKSFGEMNNAVHPQRTTVTNARPPLDSSRVTRDTSDPILIPFVPGSIIPIFDDGIPDERLWEIYREIQETKAKQKFPRRSLIPPQTNSIPSPSRFKALNNEQHFQIAEYLIFLDHREELFQVIDRYNDRRDEFLGLTDNSWSSCPITNPDRCEQPPCMDKEDSVGIHKHKPHIALLASTGRSDAKQVGKGKRVVDKGKRVGKHVRFDLPNEEDAGKKVTRGRVLQSSLAPQTSNIPSFPLVDTLVGTPPGGRSMIQNGLSGLTDAQSAATTRPSPSLQGPQTGNTPSFLWVDSLVGMTPRGRSITQIELNNGQRARTTRPSPDVKSGSQGYKAATRV